MTSWKPQTIGHEEVIRGLIHSTRPSIIDLSCSTKGSEVGMTSIFQKEQELHALQKALNLPQTASYSTTLHQLKPAQLNSTFIPPYSQHARAVAETKLDTESDMSRTLDLSHLRTSRNENTNFDQLSTISGMHGNFQQANESRNFDHMKTETVVNGAHGLVQGQRNTCITKPFDAEIYNTSNIPIKINQEFDKSECRWTESSHFLPKQEMQHSETLKLHQNHLTNALQSGSNGYSYVMRTPRYHFDDTEILLEKIKEAYKIIEHQKHALAKSENEIIALHRHQKMLELNQEVSLQEITTLKLENQNMDKMKSENTKKREALLERINKLDQDFKELSVSHNALLIECKKREGDFLQSDLKLNALEAYNNNLQQDNTRMLKECEMAKQQVSEIMAENRRMQMEVQKARGETALALQDKQSIAIENTSLQSASSEMNKQLVTVKSSKDKLRQEFEKLHMEYNVKCNRVSLLEEEVKQQQETLEVLQQELEQSFQREARKSAMENHLLNVSLREKLQDGQSFSNDGYRVNTASSEIEMLKAQLIQERKEKKNAHDEVKAVKSEHSRLVNKNKSLKEKLDYIKNVKGELEKEVLDISHDNESLYAEITGMKEEQSYKVNHLQEELMKIKGKLTSLETEKSSLVTELQEFQQEKDGWEKDKGEMMMSLAELEAENNELQQKLKQALEKLNKLNEEADELRRSITDIASKSTSRNVVISTLGSEIEERDKKIGQLENELSAKTRQYDELCSSHNKLEIDLNQSSSEALQWITTERKKLEEQKDILKNQVLDLQSRLDKGPQTDSIQDDSLNVCTEDELQTLKSENETLVSRLKVLMDERDSVLQDSEDLMEGMQQLKEAFEEEIERRLERERERFMEEHVDLVNEYNKVKEQQKLVDEANKSLELQCKNLEFERDELRKQVNELCENTLTEEKATQTDLFQSSPRRKEPRGRKRSKSVGVIVPIISIDGVDGEESNSSPDRSPTSDSPRHQKHS